MSSGRTEQFPRFSAKRLALLDVLRREQGMESPSVARISRSDEASPAPLSRGQESLCVIDRLFPGSPLYNLPFLLHLEGELSHSALASSLRALVERHDSLRLRFVSSGEQWLQEEIPVEIAAALRLIDLSVVPDEERPSVFAEEVEKEARRSFDLAHGPLHRAVLFRLEAQLSALLVTLHHAIADASSIAIYVRELSELYDALSSGRTPRLPHLAIRATDFARWQRRWLESEEAREHLSGWRARLAGKAPVDLPFDESRPLSPTFRRGEIPVSLDGRAAQALGELGREQQATPFMTLLAAFGAQLHRYVSEDRLIVGSPASQRHRGELEGVIGFFVNLLPLAIDAEGNPTFRELLARVREATLESYSQQELPFEKLIEELQPERSAGRTPLVSVTFSLGQEPAVSSHCGGLTWRLEQVGNGTVKFDLALELRELSAGIAGAFAYSRDLFSPLTVMRWARHFEVLAAAVADDPNRPLSEVPLLSAAERQQVVLEWNDTRREDVGTRYVVDRFWHPVPLGIPGELWSGDDGVGEHPEQSFVPDPWSREPGARLYRTGDLVRLLPDGQLESLGRLDSWRNPVAPGEAAPTPEPSRPLEEILCGLWAEILGLRCVGVGEDFFELGGHSLLANRILVRMRSILGVDLPLRTFFAAPTVAALARAIGAARDAGGPETPPLVPVPRTAELALSFAQQRLWLLQQLEPDSAFYNVPFALRLEGPMAVDVLAAAVCAVVARHEALRTSFRSIEGKPVQVIHQDFAVPLPLIELGGLPQPVRQAELGRLAADTTRRPFDLERDPLLRLALLRLSECEHVLLVSMHHIVSDARSARVFLQELSALYGAVLAGRPVLLPELPVQYADFAAWQRRYLSGERLETLLSYWRQRLAGLPPLLDLPFDRPRPAVQSYAGRNERFTLSGLLPERLRPLMRRQGATLFMTLLAAFQALMYRHTGREDVAAGTPVSGRGRAEVENLIGFFLNTLVMRSQVDGRAGFHDLLRRVRDAALEAYAHQDLPFEHLVEELQPERSLSHSPLFQVMFVLQDERRDALDLPGVSARLFPFDSGTSKFDLTLSMSEKDDGLRGTVEYNTDLFDTVTVQRLVGHWERLLEGIAAQGEASLADLPLITAAERQQLVTEWNDTATLRDLVVVHAFFERQVERTPDATALDFAGSRLTYRELEARANQLAHHLIALGVAPESRVGICVERSHDMLVATLAALKAGGTCVPLDPEYPTERLAFMLCESEARVLLTQAALAAGLPGHGAHTVLVDRDEGLWAARPAEAPRLAVEPEHLVYVIYTSGSTGRPKGVGLPHGALANLLEWYLRVYPGSLRTLQFASLSFDVSFLEAFATWGAGGTLVVAPERVRRDPAGLASLLAEEEIERVTLPVLLLQQLGQIWSGTGAPPRLREITSTGEQLQITPPVVELYELSSELSLHNLYGPSESHVVTAYSLDPEPRHWPSRPPIGRPVANTRIELLDRNLSPVPAGVVGELYIGGANLARGYLHRPELTAEKFVPDPLGVEPGARLYRTGDLARCLRSGDIEYLGRADHQVKVRGFRVEPGEIEAVLTDHPRVREAVALAVDGGQESRRLVAWFVPEPGAAPTQAELRAHLRERLPDYMIPSAFVCLDALPLTPNRKLDRKALPQPERICAEHRLPPQTPVEEVVAVIWCEVLGLEEVGREESFFELGGHSLLATQVISRLRSAFAVEVPLRRLFEQPTVAGLAEAVEALRRKGASAADRIQPRLWTGSLPLSFSQERLLFFSELGGSGSIFNLSVGFRLRGRLDAGALDRSLCEIVRRHEVLRTALSRVAEQPVQSCCAAPLTLLMVIDLRHVAADQREASAQQWVEDEAWRPFDLARAPQLKAGLLRLDDEDHVLLVTTHHLVFDGWSMAVLLRELGALYEAFADGRPSPLGELLIQYADYAVWQRERLQGEVLEGLLAYWQGQLAGAPPALALPADRPRPAVQTYCGGKRDLALDSTLLEGFQALCRREGVSLFMGLFAVFALLLHRTSGQDDLVVGTPIAGRNRTETEGLIGCFINNLALRVTLGREGSFRDLLRRVREITLGAYDHQELPFERLVEDLRPVRDLSRTPVFQVMFALQNVLDQGLALPGVTPSPLRSSTVHAQFDLTLWVTDWRRGRGYFNYNADLFDAVTVERMSGHFQRLLAAALADPQARISSLGLLTHAERCQLLFEWNDTGMEIAGDGACVHHLFEARVSTSPDAVAVLCGRRTLTYRELNRRANRVARRLRALGVGPEDRVGICLERSVEMLAGLLGTLKTGAAYLPLDPAHPRERLSLILEDAGAAVLLAHAPTAAHLPAGPAQVLMLDQELATVGPEDDRDLDGGARPENLAYVIYTSGSTGRPKGVLVRHDGVINFFAGMDERIGSRAGDTWLATTGISFDISVLELLWTLTRGLRVVLRAGDPVWSSSTAARAEAPARPLAFSLFYFASDEQSDGREKYRLLIDGAKLADRHGFHAVWTPERHFHDFGGLYPNPSVTSAALAAVTERVQIRAGSVVLPLQDPLRVAEEWSVVDNLSSGRVGISFASGWHADDFVLAPDNYRDRKAVMLREIETVRRLWRGESVRRRGGAGNEVEVRIRPLPVQRELPVWVTGAGSPETARMAGEIGAGLLTHLLAQTFESLAATVSTYREAWRRQGHPGEGQVTLMIHTFIGDDLERVREAVRKPFCRYLESSLDLINNLMRSIGRSDRPDELSGEEREALLAFGFERYFPSLSLMGTPETALATLERLAAAGVDEVACLIDFGVETEAALSGLERLASVRDAWLRRSSGSAEEALAAQIAGHGVTHLQCTPAMAEMLVSDPGTRGALAPLSALLVGGEALPLPLAQRLREHVSGRVFNMYGPTETTVWSAVSPIADFGDSVSIGRPIANTSIHLLDAHLDPVPAGVPGELYIGGRGLARGYNRRPDLTAERFLPDLWAAESGGRLYRTGDLARRRYDGSLEFLGRADHQVKIRGYRIELGEIEAVLASYPGVRQSVVVAREDGAGDRRLVAYMVPAADGLRRLQPRQAHPAPPAGKRLFTLPNGMPVVSLDDYLTSELYKEIFELRRYSQHGIVFEDGACIFDVGANVGFFTLFAHSACRNPRVFSFEPIPPTFEVLRANVELYGLDVRLLHVGVGEREDLSQFTFYPNMPGLSGRHAEGDFDRAATRSIMDYWVRERVSEADRAHLSEGDLDELLAGQLASETFACPVRTLSDVMAEHGIERIDLLKVDVERSEHEVLQGIRDEDWPKIQQVVLEVDTKQNRDRILSLLRDRGFECAVEDLIVIDGDESRAEVYVAMLYARRPGLASADRPAAVPVGRDMSPRDLRAFLAERLPEPMIPSAFHKLATFPLNANGKVDRKALPEPEKVQAEVATPYVAPRQGLEEQIAGVWQELLLVDQVGLRDNFFELGGSSLLVVRVRNRLQEILGRDLSLVDLFRHPTVESLAGHLAADDTGPGWTVQERIDKQRSARERRRRARPEAGA